MVIYSDACDRVIDITLEYQTKPLLEMQQKLAESESEEEGTEKNEEGEKVEASKAPVEAESPSATLRVSFSMVV